MKFFLMTIAATFLLGQAQAHERGFFDDTFDMTFDLQKNAVQFVVKDKKGHLVIDGLEVLSGKCGGNLDWLLNRNNLLILHAKEAGKSIRIHGQSLCGMGYLKIEVIE